MPDIYLSVLAPCYNEQEVLAALHARVTKVCEAVGKPYEFILVNDGSRDETWRVMTELAAKDPHLVLVNLSRNHGHQLALTAGLSTVRGQRIMILDADLQDPPELLPQLLAKMDEGVDVVYAQRRTRPGDAKLKAFACAVFYRMLQKLSDTHIPLDAGDFRLLSRRVVDHLNAMPERHRFLRGLSSWVGYRQEPVMYDRDARAAGETKYPLRKLIALGIDGMTSFSIKPLHFATYFALFMALFGFGLLIYSVISIIFFPKTPPGWTSMMAAFAIVSSMQFLVLGIIGDYLGRLYEQSKNRPLFIIERVVRKEE